MKINKIEINNFRLLKNLKLDLEEDLSLVIGKNNTGKTSILSILDKFLNANTEKKKIYFEDLNISLQEQLNKIINSEVPFPSESEFEKLQLAAGISLIVFIEYTQDDDISLLQSLITSLKESFFLNNNSVKTTLARYAKNDKINIYQMYITNGNKAGFLVRRNSWSDQTATIISIAGKTEGILDGTSPYFNHAKVMARMNGTGDLIEISDPGTYNYSQIYSDNV